jgi:hypothetical protein
VPELVAAEGPRSLIAEIRGDDMYDAGVEVLVRGVTLLVGIQRECIDRIDDLLAIGMPDWRAAPLTAGIADVAERTRETLTAVDRAALDEFIDDLPNRFAAIAACGIPDSLVHGDFSPGNLRGGPESLVLLDWGDSGVGHPLLDQPAMLERAPADAADPLRARWVADWHEALPDSEPERAAELLAPVAAARQAVIYQGFLDRIEPSERIYHRSDPARWLGRVAELVRQRRPARTS